MKKYIIILLLITIAILPILAVFPQIVHDQVSWLQDLEEYIKEAERYSSKVKKWQREIENYEKKYKALESGDFNSIINTIKEVSQQVNKRLDNLKDTKSNYNKKVKKINDFQKDIIKGKLDNNTIINKVENLIDNIDEEMEEIVDKVNDLNVVETKERLNKVNSSIQENLRLATSESIQEQLGAIIKQLSTQTELMIEYNEKIDALKEYEKTLKNYENQKEILEYQKEYAESENFLIEKNTELIERIEQEI